MINLTVGQVESNVRLGPNQHGPGDPEELIAIEKKALQHEAVLAEIRRLQLPKGAVVCADPWIYGNDDLKIKPYRV